MTELRPRSVTLPAAAADAARVLARLSAGDGRGFLLERGGEPPLLAYGALESLRVLRGRVRVEGPAGRRWLQGRPFEALGQRLAEWRAAGRAGAWTGGAAGYLAYEMVRHLERLPERRDLDEEGLVTVFDSWLRLDADSASLTVWLPADLSRREAERRFEERASAAETALSLGAVPASPRAGRLPAPKGALGPARFKAGVRRIREHIRAGDIFQCVLSEKFTVPASPDPARLYAELRTGSPSPYHFWLRDGSSSLVGASPERLIRVDGRRALYCPIAGTRPRGRTTAADKKLERSLVRSPKERAEHLMLVDLGRNDLGRVCAPGSVKVTAYQEVRRFSNVMHLVSEIEGRLEAARSSWDALGAAFPAGTVSGAPKVRAMEILSGLEPRARGFYAGAVLMRDLAGNLDSCIAIRSLRVGPRETTLQAGAGVVADSTPEREYQEVLHKLSAGRKALAAALA